MFHRTVGIVASLVVVLLLSAGLCRAEDDAKAVVFTPHTIKDTTFNYDAIRILAPKDWKVEGQIGYNQVPSLARLITAKAVSPDGTKGVQGLSGEMVYGFWTGPFGQAQPGQLYFGSPVMAPVDAPTYFKAKVLPQLQKDHENYEVVEFRREPKLAAAVAKQHEAIDKLLTQPLGGTQTRMDYDSIFVRATFTVNGKKIEDEIYVTFKYMTMRTGQMANASWGPILTERYWAPAGTLEKTMPLLKAIGRNSRPNMKWYTEVENHRYKIWKRQNQAQREIWDDYVKHQNEMSKRRDESYEQFNRYIRGTEVKKNPIDDTYYEVPNDYRNTWFSNNGEVLFTDADLYNPNSDLDLNGNWQRAENGE